MADTRELYPHESRVIPTDLEGPERVTAIQLRGTDAGQVIIQLDTAGGSVIVECEDADARDLARALTEVVENM